MLKNSELLALAVKIIQLNEVWGILHYDSLQFGSWLPVSWRDLLLEDTLKMEVAVSSKAVVTIY
jgi:hypothetical protein